MNTLGSEDENADDLYKIHLHHFFLNYKSFKRNPYRSIFATLLSISADWFFVETLGKFHEVLDFGIVEHTNKTAYIVRREGI